MARYKCLITQEGLDAVIKLADDPKKAVKQMKKVRQLSDEEIERRAKVIYTLEEGKDPFKIDNWTLKEIVNRYRSKASSEVAKKSGGSDLGSYFGFELRKRYVGGRYLEVTAEMSESEMKKARSMGVYKGALEVLNNIKSIHSGAGDDPAKTVLKWMKKMEVEIEDD